MEAFPDRFSVFVHFGKIGESLLPNGRSLTVQIIFLEPFVTFTLSVPGVTRRQVGTAW